MPIFIKGLGAALCALMLSAQANAGALAELEALSKAAPEDFGRVYDNNAARSGAPETGPAYTQEKVQQLMLSDLDALRNIIAARYAPAGFKGSLNGWDLDAEIAKAKAQVAGKPDINLKEYQHIVQGLFASMQDYHVSVSFHSTEAAMLPLRLTYSGGRYYITDVNRQALPEAQFPFKAGDEVTSLDGRPIADAVNAYLAENGMNNVPDTDRALAAAQLTVRAGSKGNSVPQGPAALGVKAAGAEAEAVYQLKWIYGKELIPSPFRIKLAGDETLPMSWLYNMSVDQFALTGTRYAAGAHDMGDKNGPLPALGERIWEAPAGSLYRAYVYRNPVDGRRAGYVRLPTWMVKDSVKMTAEFARLMAEFNERTDYLVIDQLNNPGGSVFYLYSIASMLTDKPLALPKHRITLTQSDVAESINFIRLASQAKSDEDARALLGDTLDSYPVSLAFLQGFLGFQSAVVQQWGQGKTFTDPLPIAGLGSLPPAYGARYAKPLMILTNELDFSGGDFFPAIMQDNGRAVTFGARTAGAGGVVKSYQYQNSLLGMGAYNLTGTLAIRADGQPIESLGVTPDIPYAVQPGDIQQGFKDYIAAANAAAAKL